MPELPLGAAWLACAAGFLAAARRGRGGGWRLGAWAGATILLGTAWLSPLQMLAQQQLLSVHLLQVTLLIAAVAPLYWLSVPLGDEFPRARLPRAVRWLMTPISALLIFNAIFMGMHLGVLYDYTLQHAWAYDVAQVLLLAAALLFWRPLIAPGTNWIEAGFGRLLYILIAAIPPTFAGMTLALAPHQLYTYPAVNQFGFAPHDDQVTAGVFMAVLSKAGLIIAFIVLFRGLLHGEGDEDDDGGTLHRVETPPSDLPGWLRFLTDDLVVREPQPAPVVPREIRIGVREGVRPDKPTPTATDSGK